MFFLHTKKENRLLGGGAKLVKKRVLMLNGK